MREVGRVKVLAIWVAILSALLIVTSRYVGQFIGPESPRERRVDAGRGGEAPSPDVAGASGEGVPDLSFYRTLGSSGGGTRQSSSPGDLDLRPPDASRASEGVFLVQVLASPDASVARRLRDRLASRGLPARVVEGRAAGEPIYRVRVGWYRERRTAEVVARKIEAAEGVTPWVLREER